MHRAVLGLFILLFAGSAGCSNAQDVIESEEHNFAVVTVVDDLSHPSGLAFGHRQI